MVDATCEKCGTLHQFDDAEVPPSGKVISCRSCGTSVTVMPHAAAAMGLTSPAARKATAAGVGTGKPPAFRGGPALAAFEADAPADASGPGDILDLELDLAAAGALDGAAAPRKASPLEGFEDIPSGVSPRPSALDAAHLDLPAPKGPAPSKRRDAALDLIDLPAPKAAAKAPPPDLPAPKGAGAFFDDEIVDLPAPKGPGGRAATPEPPDVTDLPAPKGNGFFASDELDLPAPKGPAGLTDLPAPKGPAGLTDLPAPKGPAGLTDLPAPKGPAGLTDLPAPKGPAGLTDLPAPKGPGEAPGLPAPKGFFDDIPAPRAAAPAPPAPTTPAAAAAPAGSSADLFELPAPKGFFDEAPEAKKPAAADDTGGHGFFDLDTGGEGALELDELDLVPPATEGSVAFELGNADALELEPVDGGADSLDFSGALELGVSGPSDGDIPDLELDGGPGGGSQDFGLALPEDDDGVVSFSKASARATPPPRPAAPPIPRPAASGPAASSAGIELARPPVRPGPGMGADAELELDAEAAPEVVARAQGTAPARKTSAEREAEELAKKRQKAKKQRLAAAAALGVALAGAAGFIGFQKWQDTKARAATLDDARATARNQLRAGAAGHWDEAARAAERALAVDPNDPVAVGLAVQAYYGGLLDEGTAAKERRAKADPLVQRIVDKSLQGPEVAKAEALRAILDGLPARGVELLEGVLKTQRKDADALLYLGWAHAAAQNWDKAASAFQRAAEAAPKRQVPAVYGLGRAQLELGQREDALATFRRVLDELGAKNHIGAMVGIEQSKPGTSFTEREGAYLAILKNKDIAQADPRAVALAQALAGDEALRAGRIDEARRRYDLALERDPENVVAHIGRAKAALRQNQLADARDKLEAVRKIYPHNADAALTLAEVATAQGNLEEALALADELLAGEGRVITRAEQARAQLVRGQIFERDEAALAQAIEAYQAARELAGADDITSTVALANLFSRIGGDENHRKAVALLAPLQSRAEGDSGLAITLGVAYLGTRDGKTAETWFRKALAARPGDVEATFQLGKAMVLQKRHAEAVQLMSTAYDTDESREDIGLRLAQAYEELERDEDAGKLYARLLARAEASVNLRARAGRYYARTGQLSQAGEQGKAILEVQPSHSTGLYLRGEGFYGAGDYTSALRDFHAAVSLEQSAQYLEALGRAYEGMERPEDALRAYERASEQDPRALQPLVSRGRLHVQRREYDPAIRVLNLAANAPNATGRQRAEIQFGIGRAYQEKKDPGTAVRYLREATRHEAQAAEAWYRLGECYYDLGKTSDAASALARATQLADDEEPWLTEAWRKLGYALRERNRAGAIKAFEEYLARDPSGAEALDAKKELVWLKGKRR